MAKNDEAKSDAAKSDEPKETTNPNELPQSSGVVGGDLTDAINAARVEAASSEEAQKAALEARVEALEAELKEAKAAVKAGAPREAGIMENAGLPSVANTPDARLAASGFDAHAVIGQTEGGTFQVYATPQDALDEGAAIVDRAGPSISPILASEPAALRNRA